MLCDGLERGDGAGGWRLKGKGYAYTYISPIQLVMQQKLTQHCKPIIFQLQNKSKEQPPLSILKEQLHVEDEIYHLTPTQLLVVSQSFMIV